MKSLMSLIFLLAFTIGVSAQGFGLRVGANVANLTSDINDNETIVSWQFGGVFDVPVTESTTLNIGALYSKKGTKNITEENINLAYLDIPVILRFEVLPPIFLQGGVYGSYLLSADRDDEDIKETLKSGDFGILIGAGLDISKIRLDARYNIGMSNVSDISVESLKNSVITLGLEYVF